VAPNTVSGRVVKTVIFSPLGVSNTSSAPTLRPIQLRCIAIVLSDQSSVSRLASNRSA
jgi:hypothetical protein